MEIGKGTKWPFIQTQKASGGRSGVVVYQTMGDTRNMKKLKNTLAFIDKHGVRVFIRECYYRVLDNYYEEFFAVKTKGQVLKEELGTDDPESNDYSSLNYRYTINILNKVPLDK